MPALDPLIFYWVKYFIALVFLLSLSHKFRDFGLFAQQVRDYRVIPSVFITTSAVLIVLSEAAVVLLLIVTDAAVGIYLASFLLLIYAIAMMINLLRGRTEIDCGCAGPGNGQAISYALVIRNCLLAILVLSAGVVTTGRVLLSADYVMLILSLVVSILLYLTINQLIANSSQLVKLKQ